MDEIRTTSLNAELPKKAGSDKAKRGRRGQVKPVDRERCPVCVEKFLDMGNDWGCPAHLTRPRRYQIQLFWRGHGLIRVYSDRLGNPLSSIEQANETLAVMRDDIKSRKFDPRMYSKKDQRKFRFDYLAKEWLRVREKELQKKEIAPKHFENMKSYVERLFIPFFGLQDVREVKKARVVEFKNSLDDRLNPKTVKNVMSFLHSMFVYWEDLELIERVPKFPKLKVPQTESWSWVDEETQAKILDRVPADDKPIMFFIAYQGVRPSEARALQWRDLDFKSGSVRIRRTWSSKELRLPKGKKERVLPLDPEVQEILQGLQRPFDKEAFVFQRNGKHYSESYCRKLWHRICREMDIRGVGFYGGTRHSLASQFVSDGGSLNDIKEFLGHTDIRTTLRYAHSDLRAKRRVIQRRKASIIRFRKGV
jgi:integrase